MPHARTGGWTAFDFALSPEAEAVFAKAVSRLTGARYKPFAVATQTVAGTNYVYLSQAQPVSPDAPLKVVKIHIFKPLNGEPHVEDAAEIVPFGEDDSPMKKEREMPKLVDHEDFSNPISNLLDKDGEAVLTEAARALYEGDLLALAWRNHTVRTDKLSPRDLSSIEEAFRKHSLYGASNSPVVGGGCCCTCTPACCCCAAAVIKAA